MARAGEAVGNCGPEIDDRLLATVAATAAGGVLGVARLHDTLPDRILRTIRRSRELGGVKTRRTADGLHFDVSIVIEPDTDLVNLVRRVEGDVTDAVSRVDNRVSVEVKVHIRDVASG